MRTTRVKFWVGMSGALLRRPDLIPTAVTQTRRLAATGWWRRPPFLPLPARDYLEFRIETASGASGELDVAETIEWLEWCRSLRSVG